MRTWHAEEDNGRATYSGAVPVGLQWREDVRGADGTRDRHKFARAVAPTEGAGAVSKRQAQRLAWDQILSKLDTVSVRPQSLATVREFILAKFEPQVIWAKKPGGQEHYRTMLKHILPALGEMRLRDVGLENVQGFLKEKLEEGYSVQTAAHLRNAISKIFRHARKLEYYSGQLPSEGVELPEMVRKERRALTTNQAQQIIAVLRSPYRELALVLMVVGLRIAEACGLRWKHVNFDAGLLEIRESFRRGQYQTVKSKAGRRDVPLPECLLPELARLRIRSLHNGPDDPVFVSSKGTPLWQQNILKRNLKPTARNLGMPWVSWHCFRHTAATLGEQAGLTISEAPADFRSRDRNYDAGLYAC